METVVTEKMFCVHCGIRITVGKQVKAHIRDQLEKIGVPRDATVWMHNTAGTTRIRCDLEPAADATITSTTLLAAPRDTIIEELPV